MRSIRFAVMTGYLWITLILFGALVFETAILYPNQFHDVPRSLATTNEFMAVAGIGTFMRPVGAATVVISVIALVALWRRPPVRSWIAASLAVLVAANFVFSVLYFWPANAVMFTEGLAVHSAAELQDVARGFVAWNFVRIAGCGLSAGFCFVAFLRFVRSDSPARGVSGSGR